MDEDQYAVPPGEQSVLLDAIDRVNATPVPPDGAAVRVLGGVIDQRRDRVAWVDRYQFGPEADGWVSVWLNLSGDGTARLPHIEGWTHREPKPRVSVQLAPDRDDKVTGVDFLRFFGSPRESLVVGYTWSGRHHLCRLTLSAPGLHGVQAHWVDVGDGAAVVVDGERSWDPPTLWYSRQSAVSDDGLLYGLRLPDLTPQVPIPVPLLGTDAEYTRPELTAASPGTVRWTERLSDGGGRWRDGRGTALRQPGTGQRGVADDPSVVWDRLRAALAAGAPPDGPDILIGALTVPFWDPTGPVSPGIGATTQEVLRGPWWFPAGWYHYLRTPVSDGGAGRQKAAAVWLAWLDRLASQADDDPRTGWDPSWSREEGSTRFALTHLRHQAGALAAACRAGTVPVLGDFGTWRHPPVLSAAPPGFARAWREMPKRFRAGTFQYG